MRCYIEFCPLKKSVKATHKGIVIKNLYDDFRWVRCDELW